MAYFLLRMTLGLNVTMHGVTRLIAGPSVFADTLVHQFAGTPLPVWSVHWFALCLPWAEAIVGLGILLGVATRLALVAGILEIFVLTFGTTLRQDWNSAGLQLTYAFVYAVLLATCKYNTFSVDGLLWSRASHEGTAHTPGNSEMSAESSGRF